ncbi:MAG: hypothetical protein IPO61_07150 [Gammaproteobacteria bacterium]|nr:hypothetical protein [Gammaproteobacteria bacterium]
MAGRAALRLQLASALSIDTALLVSADGANSAVRGCVVCGRAPGTAASVRSLPLSRADEVTGAPRGDGFLQSDRWLFCHWRR